MSETVKIRSEFLPGLGTIEVPVGDIVLTFRSEIVLVDGRVVSPRGIGFLGPTSDELKEGGGYWYEAVYQGAPESVGSEWISSREVVEIRILGMFNEWPALDNLPLELEDDLVEVMTMLDEALYQAEPIYWTAVSRRVEDFEGERDALRRERDECERERGPE